MLTERDEMMYVFTIFQHKIALEHETIKPWQIWM